MASLTPIEPLRCHTCHGPATQWLVNRGGVRGPAYCDFDAPAALEALEAAERDMETPAEGRRASDAAGTASCD